MLDPHDKDAIMRFYGQPKRYNFGGVQLLNETATGPMNKPFALPAFASKIQGLHQGRTRTRLSHQHALVRLLLDSNR